MGKIVQQPRAAGKMLYTLGGERLNAPFPMPAIIWPTSSWQQVSQARHSPIAVRPVAVGLVERKQKLSGRLA